MCRDVDTVKVIEFNVELNIRCIEKKRAENSLCCWNARFDPQCLNCNKYHKYSISVRSQFPMECLKGKNKMKHSEVFYCEKVGNGHS